MVTKKANIPGTPNSTGSMFYLLERSYLCSVRAAEPPLTVKAAGARHKGSMSRIRM